MTEPLPSSPLPGPRPLSPTKLLLRTVLGLIVLALGIYTLTRKATTPPPAPTTGTTPDAGAAAVPQPPSSSAQTPQPSASAPTQSPRVSGDATIIRPTPPTVPPPAPVA